MSVAQRPGDDLRNVVGMFRTDHCFDAAEQFAPRFDHEEFLLALLDDALPPVDRGHARGNLNASRKRRIEQVPSQRFAKSPLCTQALFLEAEANYRAGNLDVSLAQFEALAGRQLSDDLTPKVLFRSGLLHCQRARWPAGEQELKRLLAEFPKFENALEARLWLGRAEAQRKDFAQARATLDAVASADKGMLGAQARLSLGELALDSGDLAGALSMFLRVAVLYSDVELIAQANWGAGRAFERSGEPDKAAQSYRELLTKAPKSPLATGARERLAALASR